MVYLHLHYMFPLGSHSNKLPFTLSRLNKLRSLFPHTSYSSASWSSQLLSAMSMLCSQQGARLGADAFKVSKQKRKFCCLDLLALLLLIKLRIKVSTVSTVKATFTYVMSFFSLSNASSRTLHLDGLLTARVHNCPCCSKLPGLLVPNPTAFPADTGVAETKSLWGNGVCYREASSYLKKLSAASYSFWVVFIRYTPLCNLCWSVLLHLVHKLLTQFSEN